jgi:MoaA/NifB/PqqE/SkfB family radical SAM enzyme
MELGRIGVVLRSLKEITPALYITGGEPTLVPHISEALRFARQIGCWPVCINMNALVLDKRPGVLEHADRIVVSLHAGTPQRHAQMLGVSRRQGELVFDNIRQAARAAKSNGNRLSVNCVLTGNNTKDARGVMNFCLRHEIPIAVVPAIQRHVPTVASGSAEQLRDYREFLGEVIALKAQQPSAVIGAKAYLEHIRHLGGFKCRPSAVVTISPEGNIVNPCAHKYRTVPKTLGKANGIEPIEQQLRRHLKFASAYETCGGNCLKMCYLGPALFLGKPWPSASDILS